PRLRSGRSGGARTPNPRFWRPVLYQLSYTPILERHARASRPWRPSFYDLGDDAGADGAAAFADRKAQPLVHRNGGDQFDLHRNVVARHHHLGALRQLHRAGHTGRAAIKLWPAVAEKRRVPPPLLLGHDVGVALKPRVRPDR